MMLILINSVKFFLIAVGECFLSSLNSKFRQRSKKLLSFFSQFINILIWYFILRTILDGSMSWVVVVFYAIGFAVGDVLAIHFDLYLENLARKKGMKIRRKKRSKGAKKRR